MQGGRGQKCNIFFTFYLQASMGRRPLWVLYQSSTHSLTAALLSYQALFSNKFFYLGVLGFSSYTQAEDPSNGTWPRSAITTQKAPFSLGLRPRDQPTQGWTWKIFKATLQRLYHRGSATSAIAATRISQYVRRVAPCWWQLSGIILLRPHYY